MNEYIIGFNKYFQICAANTMRSNEKVPYYDTYILLSFDFREESMVMSNLRKRVPACDLERRPIDESIPERSEQQLTEEKPLLLEVYIAIIINDDFELAQISQIHTPKD